MPYSARLATSVHILLAIYHFENKEKVTSTFLANSIQTNPVIVRNLLGKLQKVRKVSSKTFPVKPLIRIISPIAYWFSTSIKKPATKSLTKLCAPTPTDKPIILTPARSDVVSISNSLKSDISPKKQKVAKRTC